MSSHKEVLPAVQASVEEINRGLCELKPGLTPSEIGEALIALGLLSLLAFASNHILSLKADQSYSEQTKVLESFEIADTVGTKPLITLDREPMEAQITRQFNMKGINTVSEMALNIYQHRQQGWKNFRLEVDGTVNQKLLDTKLGSE